MHDISIFGDALIDFVPQTVPKIGEVYLQKIGGTSANLAVGVKRLGLNTKFIFKVGNDSLGKKITKVLTDEGIDISSSLVDFTRYTTVAFVSLNNGERSFSFARYHSAETNIHPQEIDYDSFLDTKILAMTGMSFTNEPIRSVSFRLLEEAKNRGVFIVMDMNYRQALWRSRKQFAHVMLKILPFLNVLKGSEEELGLITKDGDLISKSKQLQSYGPQIILVSLGKDGAFYRIGNTYNHLKTYDLPRIDTTGAGDSFFSAFCYQLNKLKNTRHITRDNMEKIVDFCNAAGALAITKMGGAQSMPTLEEILKCQRELTRMI